MKLGIAGVVALAGVGACIPSPRAVATVVDDTVCAIEHQDFPPAEIARVCRLSEADARKIVASHRAAAARVGCAGDK